MRMTALIKRIFQQLFRDKRTLALLFIAPLFVLTLMSLVFNGNTPGLSLGVEKVDERIVEKLKNIDIEVKEFENISNVDDTIKEHNLDGFLKVENDKITITLINSDPTKAKNLQMKIKQILSAEAQSQLIEKSGINIKIPAQDIVETKYIYGSEDATVFDVFSPILIGFFVFFFVFLISGIGLLKERTTGTLERLMATPIRRWEIVMAYLIGFGVFAVLQTVIVVLYSINALEIVLVGSVWNVILINLLLALIALSLGILLSSFAASEFQMIQFIPIIIVPQVFFSGIFPLEGMADWLQGFAKIMPLYYGADALKGVMYKGLGLSEISQDLWIMTAFAAVFIVLNVFALKKYRRL